MRFSFGKLTTMGKRRGNGSPGTKGQASKTVLKPSGGSVSFADEDEEGLPRIPLSNTATNPTTTPLSNVTVAVGVTDSTKGEGTVHQQRTMGSDGSPNAHLPESHETHGSFDHERAGDNRSSRIGHVDTGHNDQMSVTQSPSQTRPTIDESQESGIENDSSFKTGSRGTFSDGSPGEHQESMTNKFNENDRLTHSMSNVISFYSDSAYLPNINLSYLEDTKNDFVAQYNASQWEPNPMQRLSIRAFVTSNKITVPFDEHTTRAINELARKIDADHVLLKYYILDCIHDGAFMKETTNTNPIR